MKEKKKMFGFVVEDCEDGAVAYVGEDRKKILEFVNRFVAVCGGKVTEVEKVVLDENDLDCICWFEKKGGVPFVIYHDGRDPREESFMARYERM